MKPYSFILETLQVLGTTKGDDGQTYVGPTGRGAISHKLARRASGLTGLTARAMKKHGTVAAGHYRNCKSEHAKGNTAMGNYYNYMGQKSKFFGKAERAEGNGNYEAAALHDKRAEGYGRRARELKQG